MKKFIIVNEKGVNVFGKEYNEEGANRIWNMYNGVYEDENGEQHIYIEEVKETEEEGEQSAMEEMKNNAVKVLRDTVENAKEAIRKVVSMDDVELKDIRKYQWCVYGTADSLCKLGLVSEEEADEAREEIRDYGFEMFRQ